MGPIGVIHHGHSALSKMNCDGKNEQGNSTMDDDSEKDSFVLDPKAKSFRLKGFRWRDLPRLVVGLIVTMGLLTGFNVLVQFALTHVGRDVVLFLCGASLGYLAHMWVVDSRSSYRKSPDFRSDLPNPHPLSDRVKEIASDPSRKIEAIRLYREESGASLAAAKQKVEEFMIQSAQPDGFRATEE